MINSCGGKVIAEKSDRKLIACNKCGYIHVFPMYAEKELESFYENVYGESTPSYLWPEKVYNIKKWKKIGNVFDVGCWEGTQLEFFKKEGWKVAGSELNKRAVSVAMSKGIEVYQISIREFFQKFSKRKWDVINIAYILEHIPQPLDFLVRLKEKLTKGGIVIIEVPNEFSSFQMAYLNDNKIQPYWIALPDHVNYFNKAGIENLVKHAGYKIIHGENSFPMELFLLMGDNYLKDKSLGRKCFQKVVTMEKILRNHDIGLVSKMYSALYEYGIGRSIIIYTQIEN